MRREASLFLFNFYVSALPELQSPPASACGRQNPLTTNMELNVLKGLMQNFLAVDMNMTDYTKL